MLEVFRPRSDAGPVHLLVDSTGLKPCSSGEWLLEKHGTKTRRSWRKLHIAMDADTGQIDAAVCPPATSAMLRRLAHCSVRLIARLPRSLPTVPTIGTASTARSLHLIPRPALSSQHDPAPC
jgi:hypothetical protein